MNFFYVSVTLSLHFLYTPINVLLILALRFIFVRGMYSQCAEYFRSVKKSPENVDEMFKLLHELLVNIMKIASERVHISTYKGIHVPGVQV